jgi:hypothetical protein
MKLQRDGEHVYNPVKDRNDNVAHVINDLNKLLLDKDKLAIFIHGFNNDYGDAQAIYKEFRSRMDNTAILEVYWDGVENKVPLKIWFPSLTYSNLAGQIGLRPIINGINKPVDLIVVTHSRGAAVAISTFSDPIYDPGICAPQEEKNPICDPKACECETLEVCLCTSQKEIDNTNNIFLGYTEPDLTHIKSLAFVFFAPAIGNGHFWEGIDKYFPEGKVVDFYLGTNPKDFATSKSIVPSQAFGDTSLGGDQEAIDRVIDTYSNNSEKIHIQQVKFTHGSEHGIPGYFSKINKTKPECMFWASGLKKEKPEMCSLKPSQ